VSPRSQRIAFQIWRYAHPLGWDVTVGEVADALRLSYQSVGRIAAHKGWSTRFRSTVQDHFCGGNANIGDRSFMVGGLETSTIARYARLADEAAEQ
jgi:hypothetical protein